MSDSRSLSYFMDQYRNNSGELGDVRRDPLRPDNLQQ
jgi:hypothetical protein